MTNNNQIKFYVLLVLAISWGTIIKLAGLEGVLKGSHTVPVEILGVAMLSGTVVSGLLLTGIFDGKKGLKTMAREMIVWKAPAVWWLISVFTVPIAVGCSVLVLSPFLSDPLPAMLKAENLGIAVLSAVAAGIFVSIGEEIGWTGFLLKKVRMSNNIISTGALIGVVWGLWHLVLFIELDSFSSMMGILMLVMKLFTTLPIVRIIMIYVYENTKSFLMTTTVHISLVVSMMLFEPTFTNAEMVIYIFFRTLILLVFLKFIIKTANRR